MTTKPKAKKFRIRRGGPLSRPISGSQTKAGAAAPTEDGFGDKPFPTAAKASPADRKPTAADPKPTGDGKSKAEELRAIAGEGLTSRRLRIARRLALKHGLAPTSDYDAVRLLRKKGIDPFQKSTLLELVASDNEGEAAGKPGNLPAVTPPSELPAKYDDEARAREIFRIQRDIAARRKRNMFSLAARLAGFVFLPTLLVGIYYYMIATPLYATKSEFLIQQAEGMGTQAGGGFFSGTGFATSQDSISVQGFLQSRAAMLRLDGDIGFREHFSQPDLDFILRLPADASNEDVYALYSDMVQISYDQTEGIVKMEVSAVDPETSVRFARALVTYAEEQVDQLTQRLREDQMKGSRELFVEAEEKMLAAQQKVLDLQERLGIVDATSETTALMARINALETQLTDKQLQLQQLLDNARPNQARVDGVQGDITRIEGLITEIRAEMTQSGSESDSLARISAEMRLAELELETRTVMMQQALEQLEGARVEANRQVRYLSTAVEPIAPDEPTYPRAFENTLVSLLIFSGIYLMLSLTASILREQVSA